jgi:hypothetical protein
MADFSKQWCDLNDPEMPHDFDIEEIAATLKPDYYKSFICEGFGFLAIGKDVDDNIILFFDHENKHSKYKGWVDYVEFMSEQKKTSL